MHTSRVWETYGLYVSCDAPKISTSAHSVLGYGSFSSNKDIIEWVLQQHGRDAPVDGRPVDDEHPPGTIISGLHNNAFGVKDPIHQEYDRQVSL